MGLKIIGRVATPKHLNSTGLNIGDAYLCSSNNSLYVLDENGVFVNVGTITGPLSEENPAVPKLI